MQDGRIGIESTDEVGSTFAFYTIARLSVVEPPAGPISPAATTTVSIAKTTRALRTADSEPSSVPSLVAHDTQYSILLVEDNW
jgi:hypothetical protein